MTEEQFAELIAFGREQPGVEFKGPGVRTDKHFLAKVIRAVIGMANRRDGGLVVVGVEERGGRLEPTGLSAEQLSTWAYDHFADKVATYADPNVSFDLETVVFGGNNFLAIHVREFDEIPVLCKKDYPDVLRDGACYVRTRRKPETAEARSHVDMRELLDLATEKSLRKFLRRAHAVGINVSESAAVADQKEFEEQLGGLDIPLAEKIRSRGYWRVVIRPQDFRRDRVENIARLFPLVRDASVQLRGWDFPHIDLKRPPRIDREWVGQEYDWEHYVEGWRMCRSGQFLFLGGIPEDWRDQSSLWPPDGSWRPVTRLPAVDALYSYTEVFEFAARLALTEAGSDWMRVEITVSGLRGRSLAADPQSDFSSLPAAEATVDELPLVYDVSREDLVARPREFAAGASAELFRRFNVDPPQDLLRGMQEDLRR